MAHKNYHHGIVGKAFCILKMIDNVIKEITYLLSLNVPRVLVTPIKASMDWG